MTALNAFIAGIFIGAALGIAFMAMLSINRGERDFTDSDMEAFEAALAAEQRDSTTGTPRNT